MTDKRQLRLIGLASLMLAVLISGMIFFYKDDLAGLKNFGFLGIFLLSILSNATIILPVPTVFIAFAGGSFLNPVPVALATAAGATAGELTGYLAGVGGRAVTANPKIYRWTDKLMKRYGWLALAALAAIPNPLFDIAGIIAGMSGYSVWRFLAATMAGKTIKFLAFAFLGAGVV